MGKMTTIDHKIKSKARKADGAPSERNNLRDGATASIPRLGTPLTKLCLGANLLQGDLLRELEVPELGVVVLGAVVHGAGVAGRGHDRVALVHLELMEYIVLNNLKLN